MATQDLTNELEKIDKRLKSLELRLNHLELVIGNAGTENSSIPYSENISSGINNFPLNQSDEENTGLEARIGRVGLAWLGSIVLILGIIFLTEYLLKMGNPLISALVGYSTAGILLFISKYLKRTNLNLSFIFGLNFQVLLFFTTLRLHFFTPDPLLEGNFIPVLLLLLVVVFQLYVSLKNQSQASAVIGLIFALFVGIMNDSTHVMLPISVLASLGSVYLYRKYDWSTLLILSILLTFTVFSLWLLNNPVMMNPFQLRAQHNAGYLYLFGLAGSYSIIPVLRKNDGSNNDFTIGTIILYGFLFTLILALITVRWFPDNYVILFSLITFSCLAYSILLKSVSDWFFASAFYALYGFMAMSIAIYGVFGFPRVFLLLSVQSLVVVSMALWFRNRLMVIMNSLLFILILAVYLATSGSINGVNFSFALVALISARVINWKKSRLQIQTELIRNLYLILGFFMMLYALGKAVPGHFVALSWTIVALLYFLMSLILKNVKYRYMALGTMISAAFYLFIVDLAKIEVIYRVFAFLTLAVISIGISIYYTSRLKKSDK